MADGHHKRESVVPPEADVVLSPNESPLQELKGTCWIFIMRLCDLLGFRSLLKKKKKEMEDSWFKIYLLQKYIDGL